MQGRRVDSLRACIQPGDYFLCDSVSPDGSSRGYQELWFRLPEGGGVRHIHDGPDGWRFLEESDGAITVTPSIFAHHVKRNPETGKTWTEPGWHGYLTKGVWTSV